MSKARNFKSWRAVTDRVVALEFFHRKIKSKFDEVRFSSRIALPPIMIEEVQSALSSPHLTVEGANNVLNSLRAYEEDFDRLSRTEQI